MVEGLTTLGSVFGPEETMNRFEAEVRANGLTVFCHIDHAAGAASAGLSLRATDLLIFGTAKAGTPLMEANQTIAIDLPVKALVWQDESGATWLSYYQPTWLAQHHSLGEDVRAAIGAMAGSLDQLARAAVGS
ncbi:hypothetical protein X738_24470 [Mesorhizobium sp. LNHC209A00]|nr:DUF302 domain-containing protein [Mesorhizobium sp. LNHC209A00]ESY94330.1 hypothetical protein X738_24470 [Mesorhizobium sp. LNHC209A00]